MNVAYKVVNKVFDRYYSTNSTFCGTDHIAVLEYSIGIETFTKIPNSMIFIGRDLEEVVELAAVYLWPEQHNFYVFKGTYIGTMRYVKRRFSVCSKLEPSEIFELRSYWSYWSNLGSGPSISYYKHLPVVPNFTPIENLGSYEAVARRVNYDYCI